MLKKVHDRFHVWFGIARRALANFKLSLARPGTGVKTYLVLFFLALLAGNVMAFSYYQARITRYYLQILNMNTVRMNGDIDALDVKLNQLNSMIDGLSAKVGQLSTKTEAISAKLDKQPLPPPTSLVPPPRKCTGLFC